MAHEEILPCFGPVGCAEKHRSDPIEEPFREVWQGDEGFAALRSMGRIIARRTNAAP